MASIRRLCNLIRARSWLNPVHDEEIDELLRKKIDALKEELGIPSWEDPVCEEED